MYHGVKVNTEPTPPGGYRPVTVNGVPEVDGNIKLTTDNLPEGEKNKYFSEQRAREANAAALALKINLSNIVNNDTEGGTDKPLSAEVGKTLGAEIDALAENNYTISHMPIYLSKRFGKNGFFSTIELLDVNTCALASYYGAASQEFYRVDLDSLYQELWFTSNVTTPDANPSWYCAKILPRYSAEYDHVIAFAERHKMIYKLSTNGVINKAFPAQTLGWLRNTGIDYKPKSTGAVGETSGLVIYGEYPLAETSYYDDKDTINVWRSTDNGDTWTSVITKNGRNHPTDPEIYHFHFVKHDPYNEGHWYIGSGDSPSESNIWRSVDDGVTWTLVNDPAMTGTKQEIHRTCNVYFTEDYIYWGIDGYIYADGIGSAWVRASRNLDGDGNLIIEPLYNLGNWVRNLVQTPYGLIILTEKRPTDTSHGLIYLVKYDDLEHPILIDKSDRSYASQMCDYSYGGRIFLQDASIEDFYINGRRGQARFSVLEIKKSSKTV